MLPEVIASIGGAWAVKKILGPTLDLLGEEMRSRIESQCVKVLISAHNKIEDLEDGKAANLRVTHDALQCASLADSDLVSEYCGGILAGSRSEDGKDDSLVPFVNVVRALSSRQVRLHYDIYRSLEGIKARHFAVKEKRPDWVTPPTPPIFIGGIGAANRDTDLLILQQNGLISSFSCPIIGIARNQSDESGVVAYGFLETVPSWFGWALYAAAHNHLEMMYRLGIDDFGTLEGAEPPPEHYGESLNEVLGQIGYHQVEGRWWSVSADSPQPGEA